MSTPKTEYRIFKAEVRASKGDKPQIAGYAAVFNTPTDIGYFREQIAPGAFTKAIADKQDVKCLFNHDPNKVLGRTKSGTLRLAEDNTGLKYECDIDQSTSVGKDVHAHIERGDVDQCSFGFVVRDEDISYDKEGTPTRTIKQADLFDVSPVTYPAYPTTSVEARSNAEALKELKINKRDEDSDETDEETACSCRCRACYSAECEECDKHINDCIADNCDHELNDDDEGDEEDNNRSVVPTNGVTTFILGTTGNVTSEVRAAAPTKKVDGEELSADDFLYVGDAKKTSTWALPWHFSSEAKTKSHLRNALARFSSTEKIPSDEKAAVYKKLVAKCKEHGIDVEEEKSAGMDVEQAKRLTYLAQLL
jgi:HK97 family phage prohead protease